MKTDSKDIFVQTRSVINELWQAGFDYEDSTMSILVLLFVLDANKKKFEDPELTLGNDGDDFFSNLEYRANDPEDGTYYDSILLYLRKLETYKDIIIKSKLLYRFHDISEGVRVQLVDQLIDDLSNNSKGLFAQISNETINRAFSKRVNVKSYSSILDPCIGSGKLIVDLYKQGKLDPETVSIEGIEKDSTLALLAYINLSLHGFKHVSIKNGDTIDELIFLDNNDLLKNRFDLIVSDIPLGIKLNDKKELASGIPSSIRFYFLLIQKCRTAITDEGKIYISANSGLIKGLRSLAGKAEDFSIITELLDISEIAEWSYTKVKPYILELDKEKSHSNAEMALTKLNEKGEIGQLNIIDRYEFDFFSNIEDFGFFFSDAFDRIYYEGRENFDTLSKYFKNVNKFKLNRDFGNEDKDLNENILDRSIVKEISGFRILSEESRLGSNTKSSKAKYIKHIITPGDWILIYHQQEIKIIVSEITFLVAFSCIVLRPKDVLSDKDRDWLIAQLRSDFLQSQLLATINDTRPGLFRSKLVLKKLFFDRHTPAEKEQFINKWKEARIEELEKEKKRVESKYSDVKEQNIKDQIDLIHDLHHSLKNELSIITGAAKSIETFLKRKSDSKELVSMEEPVRKPRKGADIKLQKTLGERLNALLNASEGMSSYLNEYKTILKFDPKRQNKKWIGLKNYFESVFSDYSDFSFKIIEKYDQLKSKNEDPYLLECDKSVLRLVLTNIISNAVKYGFTEENIEYSFHIVIQEVNHDNSEWNEKYPQIELPDKFLNVRILNDGNPLSDKIKEADFFRKGFTHGTNSGSGIGTYHIKKGVEAMGGWVRLGQPKEEDIYKFYYNFYFPYPMYKTKNQSKENGEL